MNAKYRQGVELLNQGEFYQAHEVLEDAWRAASDRTKLLVQGLVQVAVALHHHSTGNRNGAHSVLARAIRNLSSFEQGFGGLDLDDLRDQLSQWSDAFESGVPASPLVVRWLVVDR